MYVSLLWLFWSAGPGWWFQWSSRLLLPKKFITSCSVSGSGKAMKAYRFPPTVQSFAYVAGVLLGMSLCVLQSLLDSPVICGTDRDSGSRAVLFCFERWISEVCFDFPSTCSGHWKPPLCISKEDSVCVRQSSAGIWVQTRAQVDSSVGLWVPIPHSNCFLFVWQQENGAQCLVYKKLVVRPWALSLLISLSFNNCEGQR